MCSLQPLDLCANNRRLVRQGSLTWRLQHRKVIGESVTVSPYSSTVFTNLATIILCLGMRKISTFEPNVNHQSIHFIRKGYKRAIKCILEEIGSSYEAQLSKAHFQKKAQAFGF